MFSSTNARERLRRSMSTRSMRRTRPPKELESVDPEIARAQARAAASRAMRSSTSATESKVYDRLGGPAQVASPKRRPGLSLRYTEDDAPLCAASIATPATPCQSYEKSAANRGHMIQDSVALPPITELQGLDGRDSSVPSSYRRLRKAKSMFSTRARTSHVPFGPPLMSPRNACEIERSPEFELPRTLRPSISFIGRHGQSNRAIRHTQSHDVAIQLARNQFIEEVESPGTQLRRSSFFTRRKREPKPFRKSFRATSDTGLRSASASRHASRWNPRNRSRAFSSSIKNGFRRVFGFSKATEQQQFEFSLGADAVSFTSPGAKTEHKSLQCTVDGGLNLDHCVMSSPLPEESPGGGSLYTSKSRVTSWADSSVADTVMTRKTRHRQSLSLIEEHGDLNKQLPQVPADPIRRQLPESGNCQDELDKGGNCSAFSSWADSNDLYTALMQQIRRQTVHIPDEDVIFGTVPEHRAIPERTSSLYSHRSRQTIRHIPSEESSTAGSFATARVGISISPQRRQPGPLGYTLGKVPRYMSVQQTHSPLENFSEQKSPTSPFVIGEETDEDTESVVIARFEALRTGNESPSVYSRTTSGNSPNKGSSNCVASIIDGETGTATIFASQRAAYTSPTRSRGSAPSEPPVHPSADWQKWMSSQIERIDKASPPKGHIRENAQFEADEGEMFTGMLKRTYEPPSEPVAEPYNPEDDQGNEHPLQVKRKPSVQNNFSRPFSRASSIQTILPSQNVHPLGARQDQPNPAAAREAPDHCVLGSSSTSARVPSEQNLSPIRTRSSNLLAPPESPTPRRAEPESQKRMWTQEQYRRYSARRPFGHGKTHQAWSMRSYGESRGMNNENTRQQVEQEDMMDDYDKLQTIHSTISTKRMVEMFLDSRRQRMGREASVSTIAGEAFI